MLAAAVTHGADPNSLWSILAYAAAAVLGAIILGVGKAAMNLVRKRQAEHRQDDADQQTLISFLFDTPSDPRTRTPLRKGWTTKVDETLLRLTQAQEQTTRLVREVLAELKPDGNGGHNFRGKVDKIEETLRTNGDANGISS